MEYNKVHIISEESFLSLYPEYEETNILDEIRRKEFSRLDQNNHVYLDYTGGGLYSESQIRKHYEMLKKGVFGNPHSTNPTSVSAEQLVNETRTSILNYFNADEYYCIFTQNATGALKIVGESYPFDSNSFLLLTFDNHNSVNGIREYAKNKGSDFSYSAINYEDLHFNRSALQNNLNSYDTFSNKLFAYPAQSNVSGVKHDLGWVKYAQERGWHVLLDASAFVPTDKLDLSIVKPEFVSMSFYKMFGYPTGLGALLVRKDAFDLLEKPWFAGGTVTLASVMADRHFLENNHAKFEDGTINYLNIPALKIGIDFIRGIGIETINKRVRILTDYFLNEVKKIYHSNGQPVIQVFGPKNTENRGGTVILNFFDSNGEVIPFYEIERITNKHNISIRSGCFCNPGIDEINHHLQGDRILEFFDSRDGGNYEDMVKYLEKMRGAIRVSFGIVSNFKDVQTLLNLIQGLLK